MDSLKVWFNRRLQKLSVQSEDQVLNAVGVFMLSVSECISRCLRRWTIQNTNLINYSWSGSPKFLIGVIHVQLEYALCFVFNLLGHEIISSTTSNKNTTHSRLILKLFFLRTLTGLLRHLYLVMILYTALLLPCGMGAGRWLCTRTQSMNMHPFTRRGSWFSILLTQWTSI